MIVRLVQIITEYVGIILCLHTFAKAKKIVNIYNILFGILDILLALCMDKYPFISLVFKVVLFLMFLLYILCCLERKLGRALKIWGCMMLIIPILQLSVYFVIKVILKEWLDDFQVSIITNIVICLLFGVWNKKCLKGVISFFRRRLGIFVVTIFSTAFLYLFTLYKVGGFVPPEVIIGIIGGIWVIILSVVLFFIAENEKKLKEKELQIYQVYNKSFEEAIIAIRQRQHEFDNHINAIKCMQYTIDDAKKLREAQSEYCDFVLRENTLNCLLKVNIEPIIIGVLYSKLMSAQEQNIEVSQEIHAIEYKYKVEIVELIEILGILIDNAVEALLNDNSEYKKLKVKIISEDERRFYIEIANTSEIIHNSDIEKFCKSGYSTKGKNRGMGIPRLLAIAKKNKAEVAMRNVIYEGLNFFSVKVSI